MTEAARAVRRSRVRAALAVLFVLLGLNAWTQVVLDLTGRADEPPPLIALQALVGALAAAAAWGTWRNARWASIACVLYGLVTAGMVAALVPILDLPREARPGIWSGAALVLLFAFAVAWYLRRGRTLDRVQS